MISNLIIERFTLFEFLMGIYMLVIIMIFCLWIGYEIGYKMGSSTVSFDKPTTKEVMKKPKMSHLKKSSEIGDLNNPMVDNHVFAIIFWIIFAISVIIVNIRINYIIRTIFAVLGLIFIIIITYVLSKKGDKKRKINMGQYSK